MQILSAKFLLKANLSIKNNARKKFLQPANLVQALVQLCALPFFTDMETLNTRHGPSYAPTYNSYQCHISHVYMYINKA